MAYSFRGRDALQGAQILFVAFGGLVLVPILTGLDPSVALFTAGAGTLLFQWITGGRIPVFLASSFAFVSPITYGVKEFGLPGTLSGLLAAGLFYLLLSALIARKGTRVLRQVLPPIVTGPVIMVIGLSLAPIAIGMATESSETYGQGMATLAASVALLATILASVMGRGLLHLVPLFAGICAGYLTAIPLGMVRLSELGPAPWFAIPAFTAPSLHWPAVIFILPVAIVPAIEHIGDILVIGRVTDTDYLKSPGLHRTLLGDGLATCLAALLGGPPNTTYSEVTGAVALTRSFNPGIMTWGAILAIALAFFGKLNALLNTIPPPVMGGVLVVLFGTIVVVGMNSLVEEGEDLVEPRNLIIAGVILVLGVGGMTIEAGQFTLEGLSLASVVGVVLNLLLPVRIHASD